MLSIYPLLAWWTCTWKIWARYASLNDVKIAKNKVPVVRLSSTGDCQVASIKRDEAFGLTGIREASKCTRCDVRINANDRTQPSPWKLQWAEFATVLWSSTLPHDLATGKFITHTGGTPSKRGKHAISSSFPRLLQDSECIALYMHVYLCTYAYSMTMLRFISSRHHTIVRSVSSARMCI